MKNSLIILTDLWGLGNSDWINFYTSGLQNEFNLKIYDSCKLAGIKKTNLVQQEIHKKFLNGGVENAVNKLINLEQENTYILGFSVGGFIAWKFANATGLSIALHCVSSTRLRTESIKPIGEIQLYFGEKDTYKPTQEWFDAMNINTSIFNSQSHELYKDPGCAERICNLICMKQK